MELIHTFVDKKDVREKRATYENYEKNKVTKREDVCSTLKPEKNIIPKD